MKHGLGGGVKLWPKYMVTSGITQVLKNILIEFHIVKLKFREHSLLHNCTPSTFVLGGSFTLIKKSLWFEFSKRNLKYLGSSSTNNGTRNLVLGSYSLKNKIKLVLVLKIRSGSGLVLVNSNWNRWLIGIMINCKLTSG